MLGLVPVIIGTMSADKETVVKEKVMFYVVKELQSIFLSKDTLVDIRIIPTYFPLPSPHRSYGTLAGLKGTSTDTIAEEECIPAKNSSGAKADCGCLVQTTAPAPPKLPFPATKKIEASWSHSS